MRKILEFHGNTFASWRCVHEYMRGRVWLTEPDETLAAIVETYDDPTLTALTASTTGPPAVEGQPMKRYLGWSPAVFRSSLTRTWMIDVAETRQLKLLDLVAVIRSSGDPEIQAGDVGTIVELLPSDALEVEFLSRDGRTRRIGTLSTDDVLVLNRERTRVA